MVSILDNLEADQKSALRLSASELLGSLVQADQYVGEVYSIGYSSALVQIHDNHRMRVGGIPGLCFLTATRLLPDDEIRFEEEDSSVILLRALDAAPMPNAAEADRIRVEAAQRAAGANDHWDSQQFMDGFTANLLSFAGVRCRVIGTFYLTSEDGLSTDDLRLRFGGDLSNYYPNRGLKVYKPNTEALRRIVNFRDPDRVQDHPLGRQEVKVGRVRYASTNRQLQGVDDVPVSLAPADLLSMKTALFGMTRTGKSNTTKIIATSVFRLRQSGTADSRIGQIIFDYNGEYANENVQDRGALKNVWKLDRGDRSDVVTYGTEPHKNDPHRRLLKLNFFDPEMLQIGKQILDEALADDSAQFIRSFLTVVFDNPPASDDFSSDATRYRRRILCYRALLARAGYRVPAGLRPAGKGLFGKELTDAMSQSSGENAARYSFASGVLAATHGGKDVSWDQLGTALEALDDFIRKRDSGYSNFNSTYINRPKESGESWADPELTHILGVFGFRNGPSRVRRVIERHDPAVNKDFAEAIIEDLHSGRLVIVDQSLGDEELNQVMADRIMSSIFRRHQTMFSHSQTPPEVLIYVEEAHNLLPDGSDKNARSIWPRVAKEGAKLHIGLVYATQEVSSVQRNILKNTSNWFIGHLNNTDETRELKKYYDFEDFEPSIRRAQDRGFLRVKTLSNPYVIPVQIDRFQA